MTRSAVAADNARQACKVYKPWLHDPDEIDIPPEARAEAGAYWAGQAAGRDERYRRLHEAMDAFSKVQRRQSTWSYKSGTPDENKELDDAVLATHDAVAFMCREVPAAGT